MTFDAIFKSNFLERVNSVSFFDMFLAIGLSFVLGFFIMAVYKKTFRGVMYSHSFSVSLLAMCTITTLIILAVTSNVILSLGMVGALSIVRFRSAVKDPLDIAFLFWAISGGIILGAGLIPLAIVGSLVVGIMFLVLMNQKIKDTPYILVVKALGKNHEKHIMDEVEKVSKSHSLKTKTVSTYGETEITIELRLKEKNYSFIDRLHALSFVESATLVSYNGDYMG